VGLPADQCPANSSLGIKGMAALVANISTTKAKVITRKKRAKRDIVDTYV
jgi:hypothetical protein